jgi:hypothetical protein
MTQKWAVTSIEKDKEITEEYRLINMNLDELKIILKKQGKKFTYAKNLTPFKDRGDVQNIAH